MIDAAVDLFSRRGYKGTSLMAIAESIGVSDVALLHYFENKSAILQAVLDREDEAANREFSEMLKPGGLESIRRLQGWGAFLEENEQTTSLQIVLGAESLSETSELHGVFSARYRHLLKRLNSALSRGVQSGEIRADVDTYHEAVGILAFLDGLRLQWFYTDGAVRIGEHWSKYLNEVIERVSASANPSTKLNGRRSRVT